MSNELEKDMDDEVYEDSFYENGEELVEDESKDEKKAGTKVGAVDEDDSETRIPISFACEDCDYRWDDVIIQTEDGEDEDVAAVCPMCGSENVSQI
jgi:hypothetical protein